MIMHLENLFAGGIKASCVVYAYPHQGTKSARAEFFLCSMVSVLFLAHGEGGGEDVCFSFCFDKKLWIWIPPMSTDGDAFVVVV